VRSRDRFLQCPLTVDDTPSGSVEALELNTIPKAGRRCPRRSDRVSVQGSHNYKVLVLFTDGEDHDSDPLEAARRRRRRVAHLHRRHAPSKRVLRTKGAADSRTTSGRNGDVGNRA